MALHPTISSFYELSLLEHLVNWIFLSLNFTPWSRLQRAEWSIHRLNLVLSAACLRWARARRVSENRSVLSSISHIFLSARREFVLQRLHLVRHLFNYVQTLDLEHQILVVDSGRLRLFKLFLNWIWITFYISIFFPSRWNRRSTLRTFTGTVATWHSRDQVFLSFIEAFRHSFRRALVDRHAFL